ncbi:FAS1-like dehydratase domain-containing protein [Halalkalibacter okhensis]|uniref:FAS1-like dehydratase domain-containing protein n=1 Tax=Halalkalibacter okhensis TaxID=333138 RepID=UPI00054FA0AC|nr:MaoC family dehydratase N-terminal domain-containing protein [Halalkalibacter okhensis]
MIDQKWTGARTETINATITREMIASYVNTIHDNTPIYVNIDAAKMAGYDDIPMPPTMPIIFWSFINVPWLDGIESVVQTKQHFSYIYTLVANRTYQCIIRLLDLKDVHSKNSSMQRSTHELIISYNGSIQARACTTILIKK